MAADEWFEYHGDLGEDERRFVEALRVRAAGWPAKPIDSQVDPPSPDLPLVAWLDLSDPAERLVLLTVGVHLDGRTLRGDELHNQLLTLPDVPTSLAFAATGGPSELAASAADWFEAILRRPVVRCEWTHRRQVYACTYLFADTGDRLVIMHNRKLAPSRRRKRGKPDTVTRIR
ncbi:hypothetical protein [Amycolatopsis silviterrae]|uniref:Uncharacterized protein n=1 Tax=Amycolatopsis silviterrae TaxID=1656914 RepID=A0ABW5H8A7_9PSEU